MLSSLPLLLLLLPLLLLLLLLLFSTSLWRWWCTFAWACIPAIIRNLASAR